MRRPASIGDRKFWSAVASLRLLHCASRSRRALNLRVEAYYGADTVLTPRRRRRSLSLISPALLSEHTANSSSTYEGCLAFLQIICREMCIGKPYPFWRSWRSWRLGSCVLDFSTCNRDTVHILGTRLYPMLHRSVAASGRPGLKGEWLRIRQAGGRRSPVENAWCGLRRLVGDAGCKSL